MRNVHVLLREYHFFFMICTISLLLVASLAMATSIILLEHKFTVTPLMLIWIAYTEESFATSQTRR